MPCHTGDVAEHQPVTLRDPSSSVTATYVPAAGMICTSLADDGVEFLGQRRGVEAYITSGKTMGVPILYPWANRLSASKYAIDGGVVTLTPGVAGVRTDEHGVPIHGVLAAYPGWVVTEEWAGGTAPLEGRELDHGFDQVDDGALFVLAGGDRRVEVTFEKGYPAAQLFAPSADDLIAVEPMAAPTDALRRENYRVAAPGEPDTSRFSIRVT